MQLSIFLVHKAIYGTFPSLLKIALGHIFTVKYRYNKKFVPKKQQILPPFTSKL